MFVLFFSNLARYDQLLSPPPSSVGGLHNPFINKIQARSPSATVTIEISAPARNAAAKHQNPRAPKQRSHTHTHTQIETARTAKRRRALDLRRPNPRTRPRSSSTDTTPATGERCPLPVSSARQKRGSAGGSRQQGQSNPEKGQPAHLRRQGRPTEQIGEARRRRRGGGVHGDSAGGAEPVNGGRGRFRRLSFACLSVSPELSLAATRCGANGVGLCFG